MGGVEVEGVEYIDVGCVWKELNVQRVDACGSRAGGEYDARIIKDTAHCRRPRSQKYQI